MSDNILKDILKDTLDAVAIYKKSIINETLEAVKERIAKLETYTTEDAFLSENFNEEDVQISRKDVFAELEKIKSEQKS